ncbi:TIGR01777 family oxidoreductase [Cellulophaga sp. E6(2014)]|uniref:TIGR01777 family oxidoreductase n=1 Tax=Cellulophaga sp. E6(2014) TaxID=1495334 RepID=UPI00051D77E2|nr:TIGR01777 family oxidoreductase [Cellulophaga sp. E6(2014)]KGK31354.1 NAD-dependent epimerase [Cellulophaga sp. E6(2014)]
MKKLIIAGGSSFLGKEIATYFASKFTAIVILTRGATETKNGCRYVTWDGKTLGPWKEEFASCEVLINMAGRSVDCRYTPKNKKLILDSRVAATRILGDAIAQSPCPPKVWINSSTATIYRHALTQQMTEETGEIGTGFSVAVAKAWEEAFYASTTPNTRKVALRTSIVLATHGGALVPIVKLAKIGFGGTQGKGNQQFSWIHCADFLESINFIIENDNLTGAVNCVAPEPVTNAILMKSIRKQLNIPFGIPLPKFLLEIGAKIIQTETELILKSRNVLPQKLTDAGFKFKYTTIESALKDLI